MAKEEKVLENVTLVRLTHPEFSQCVNRQTTEIEALGAEVLTDPTMNQLLAGLKSTTVVFDQAILQLQKSTLTDELAILDAIRDRALKSYEHALKEFKYSENPEEVKAYRKLSILSAAYKRIDKLNYEAESREMNKFLEELESDQFNAELNLLNLGNKKSRIQLSNTNFNVLFDSRSHEISIKEAYNAIVIRKSLMKEYNHFAGYILALANGLDKEPFNSSLKIMNTTRSYFDDINNRREGYKNATTEKAETVTPA